MAPPEPSGNPELDDLVARALDALEDEGEAGLARLCGEHPSQAAQLRERVALLASVGLLGAVDTKPPERLGEFRLGRQLGLGGMGIVYSAVQEKLGREVALKIIRPEHMYFPGARTRFKREVEIVARLQHPGIVPIYTVGEENGVPYFAMELLHGATLESTIARLRERGAATLEGRDLAPDPKNPGYLFAGSWEEACLRVIRQVADAVDHAHQRGVVHRDIKPSNVVVTEDATTRVVLLDFGLAASADTGKITRSGAKLGSINYMAPEQVRGDIAAIGPHSDVYALGATLYELLTLRPAYGGGTETEVLMQIERGAPRSIRELNSRVSWEAETVCLTAMEVEPSRRYASAADLARDLDNVLAHRPIEARRVGAARKLQRWVQRNPAKAAASVLAVALVVGVPSMYAWQQHRSSLAVAEQRDRAERNFGRALDAVDRMLSRVGSVDLRFMPRMEPVRRAVLEDAVKLLQEFVADESGNARAQREVAKAHARLGELFEQLGRNVEGVEAFETAAAAREALIAANPGDAKLLGALLLDRTHQASLMSSAGRGQDALAVYDKISELIARLHELAPGDEDVRQIEIDSERGRAQALSSTADAGKALEAFRHAAKEADALLEQQSGEVEVLALAQACWGELGLHLIQRYTEEGQANLEAIAALERSVDLAQQLAEREPENPIHTLKLAISRNDLAGALRRAGDDGRMMELYEEARNDLERLVAEYPDSLANKLLLATVSNQIGLVYDYTGELALAEPPYRRAVELLRELAAAAPNDAMLWSRFGQSQANLATPVGMLGDLPEAMKLVESAIEAQKRATEIAPDNAQFKHSYVEHCRMLAVMRRQARDWKGSAEAVELALAMTPEDAQLWWNAMRNCAGAVEELRTAPGLTEDERARLVEEYAERAVGYMRKANELRKPPKRDLRQLKDPAPLHGTRAFEAYADEWLAQHPD